MYKAPELEMRRPYTGKGVDLFAAVVILFIMLTGDYPFFKASYDD